VVSVSSVLKPYSVYFFDLAIVLRRTRELR